MQANYPESGAGDGDCHQNHDSCDRGQRMTRHKERQPGDDFRSHGLPEWE